MKSFINVENHDEFISKIGKKIEEIRPIQRRFKKIDPKTSVEVIFDYTCSLKHLSNSPRQYFDIAIEIKPKSPLFDDIDLPDFLEMMTNVTQTNENNKEFIQFFEKYVSKKSYQSHRTNGDPKSIWFIKFFKTQLKKSKNHLTETFTSYDPQDFFSDDIERLQKSLKSLISTPQNNLKLFTNSNLVKNGEEKVQFNEIIKEIFSSDIETAEKELVSLITEILVEQHIPKTILDFQNIYPLNGYKIGALMKTLEQEYSEGKISLEVCNIAEKIIEYLKLATQSKKAENEDQYLYRISLLMAFLISIGFRDCSIMISLHFIEKEFSDKIFEDFFNHNQFHEIKNSAKKYKVLYRAGIIDFEMKNYHHLYHYPESLKELFGLYWDYVHSLESLKK